jgi:hypothetical protein
MVAKVVATVTAVVTDAEVATKAAVKVVVKVVVTVARPAMSNAQKVAVRLKASAQSAVVAMAVDATSAMIVVIVVVTTASSVPNAWTLTPGHKASNCQAQTKPAPNALPAMSVVSVVASAANVVKAVAANATSHAHHGKMAASAMPKSVRTKTSHRAKIAMMPSPLPKAEASLAVATDGVAMGAVTSAAPARKKAATTRNNPRLAWHFQNPQPLQHPRRNRATTHKPLPPCKARDGDLGSHDRAIVTVVTVAIAKTAVSRWPMRQSHRTVNRLLRLFPHQLLRLWHRSILRFQRP